MCTAFLWIKINKAFPKWIHNIQGIIYIGRKDKIRMTIMTIIKWNHFPRYWPFLRGILRSPANSPHKDQWRGALVFSLICAWINGWLNNREAGDLRHHRAHYDVTVVTTGLVSYVVCQSTISMSQPVVKDVDLADFNLIWRLLIRPMLLHPCTIRPWS